MVRHRGIGMNRAKKTVAVVVQEAMETSDDPPDSPEPEPEPTVEPEPMPAVAHGPHGDRQECFVYDRVPLLVKLRRKEMAAAEKHFEKIRRSWERKKRTYLDSNKYSPWEEPSIVKRARQRLFDGDVELGEAWAEYVRCRDKWARWRSYSAILLRQDRHVLQHGSVDPELERFYERALQRVIEPCPRPSWKVYFAGLAHNIWDWNAQHFGLGISHGLMHSDQLFDPSLDTEEGAWARRRRIAERREEAERMAKKADEEEREERKEMEIERVQGGPSSAREVRAMRRAADYGGEDLE
jgi:hypothetical protein